MGAQSEISAWLKRFGFPLALVLCVIAGYGIGKDRAMTENNQDAALRAQQN